MNRIKYAFRMFWMVLTSPQLFQISVMKTVEDMFDFLAKTAKENHPMMCDFKMKYISKITADTPELEDKVIMHVWCGVGEMDHPIKRVRQLIEENTLLKQQVEKLNSDMQSTGASQGTMSDEQNPDNQKS